MTAVLLYAAGFGTRMRHLTTDKPKPLVKVAGRCLFDHAFDLAKDAGLTPIVTNLHYRGDMLRAHLADQDVIFSDEADILETGGGLRRAIPLLRSSPVITMNTDAVWRGPNPVVQLLAAWRDHMECLALIVPHERATGHKGKGDFLTDTKGRISRGAGAIYTGVQMIRTDRFAADPRDAFGTMDIWQQMIADGTMYGVEYTGHWCDVGQPESIPLAQKMLENHDV